MQVAVGESYFGPAPVTVRPNIVLEGEENNVESSVKKSQNKLWDHADRNEENRQLKKTENADCLKTAQKIAVIGITTAFTIVVAPIVSLVAIPIFACKSLIQWLEYKPLFNRTLFNGSRAIFGRVEGQDYTRWDGRVTSLIETDPKQQKRIHLINSIGVYIHCKGNQNLHAIDSPFQTQEDLNWLDQEFSQRKKQELLDSDLRMLRAFCKALIPIVGVFWAFFTETNIGGGFEIGCRRCTLAFFMREEHNDDKSYWEWRKAIDHHKKILANKLNQTV